MSRSKEAFAPYRFDAGANVRTGLVRVDALRIKCPICGEHKFCSVTRDGARAWCTQIESREPREYGLGVAWLHWINPSARPLRSDLAKVALARQQGPIEIRHAVYSALLATLALNPEHSENLRSRGLSKRTIALNEYRSLPLAGRGESAKKIAAQFSDADIAQVPGFYRGEYGWRLGGSPGMLVPVRDVAGCIEALKIRVDGAPEGGRYRYLSSSSKGGAKVELALHFPVSAQFRAAAEMRVTEGELKADVVTELDPIPTVSIPGVGSWVMASLFAQVLQPSLVRVAFDSDKTTNPAVARAHRDLLVDLRRHGIRVAVESWDPQYKGMDDFLLTHRILAGGAA